MPEIAILKQDFRINARTILAFYGIQFVSLLLAVGICEMKLIEISDIFWDTIPTVIVPAGMQMALAYRVMWKCTQDGTMDFLLATPTQPSKILRAKAAFVILNMALLFVFSALIGCAGSVYRLSGVWSQRTYLRLNAGAFLLQLMIGGFAFWMACTVRKTANYVRLAVGIPAVFYVIYTVYYLYPKLSLVQYLTIFSLFRQEWFAKSSGMVYVGSLIFLALGALCYTLGGYAFSLRNQPE